MTIQQQTGDDDTARTRHLAAGAYDAAIEQDLAFLRAWEDGQHPDLYCYLRIRQIRKGNPIVVALLASRAM